MALHNTYDLYDTVRCSVNFQVSAVDTDPTAITFIYVVPGSSATTLTYGVDGALVKDSTGDYHVDLSVTTAGAWYYRFRGTGTCAAADEGEFFVRPTRTA